MDLSTPVDSWLNSYLISVVFSDKSVGGVNDRSSKNPFQSSLPPLRKYRSVIQFLYCLFVSLNKTFSTQSLWTAIFVFECSGATLPAGLPERGKNWERRGSLQLLPSRPAIRVGTPYPEPISNGYGHTRCPKPSLAVEEVYLDLNLVSFGKFCYTYDGHFPLYPCL